MVLYFISFLCHESGQDIAYSHDNSCCSCYKFMNILWFVHLASELHAHKQWFLKQFVKDPATMSLKLMVVILTVYCVAVAYAAPAESQSTCTTMDGTTDCMLHTCVHASGMVDNSSNKYMTLCAGCFGNYRVEAIPQHVCDDPCLLCVLYLESGKIQHVWHCMLD